MLVVTQMSNLAVGWIAILAGLVTGAGMGVFFHEEDWLGGYSSWRRRMLRLMHISMVGTGLLNLAFVLTVESARVDPYPRVASDLFVLGAVTMPLVCALSAWQPRLRAFFLVPVLSLIAASGELVYRSLTT